MLVNDNGLLEIRLGEITIYWRAWKSFNPSFRINKLILVKFVTEGLNVMLLNMFGSRKNRSSESNNWLKRLHEVLF
jgi:hypothetical protein